MYLLAVPGVTARQRGRATVEGAGVPAAASLGSGQREVDRRGSGSNANVCPDARFVDHRSRSARSMTRRPATKVEGKSPFLISRAIVRALLRKITAACSMENLSAAMSASLQPHHIGSPVGQFLPVFRLLFGRVLASQYPFDSNGWDRPCPQCWPLFGSPPPSLKLGMVDASGVLDIRQAESGIPRPKCLEPVFAAFDWR